GGLLCVHVGLFLAYPLFHGFTFSLFERCHAVAIDLAPALRRFDAFLQRVDAQSVFIQILRSAQRRRVGLNAVWHAGVLRRSHRLTAVTHRHPPCIPLCPLCS